MKLTQVERVEALPAPWPDNTDVAIGVGVSGQKEAAYPSSTTQFIKRLRAAGVRVSYLEPEAKYPELKLMADEWWLPLLIVGYDVGVGLVAEAVVETIKRHVGVGWEKARLHARVARVKRDAVECTVAEFDGDGDAVVAAIEALFNKGNR